MGGRDTSGKISRYLEVAGVSGVRHIPLLPRREALYAHRLTPMFLGERPERHWGWWTDNSVQSISSIHLLKNMLLLFFFGFLEGIYHYCLCFSPFFFRGDENANGSVGSHLFASLRDTGMRKGMNSGFLKVTLHDTRWFIAAHPCLSHQQALVLSWGSHFR